MARKAIGMAAGRTPHPPPRPLVPGACTGRLPACLAVTSPACPRGVPPRPTSPLLGLARAPTLFAALHHLLPCMHTLRPGWPPPARPRPQDPLADGPVIQGAATRALEKGTTLDKVIAMVRTVAPHIKAPLVMFTYYKPIMRKGLANFCNTIKEAGAAGVCVCRRRRRWEGGQAGDVYLCGWEKGARCWGFG
jgi:hypothetical protein